MRTLVKYEYRKLWNRVSVVAVIAMFILSTLHTFIYLDMNSQWRAIDTNGEIISGLSSYRALKEASKDIEGTMDGEYLQSMKIIDGMGHIKGQHKASLTKLQF